MTMPVIATRRHVLPGLRPEPLASYLAGLGLIRVLAGQADPAAAAAGSACLASTRIRPRPAR